MSEQHALPAVRGELLSCYTASIAEYMRQTGIDYQLALGTQLFLSVKQVSTRPLSLRFIHYHTPARGDHQTHRLRLARQVTRDASAAFEQIAAECRRSGALIMIGDARYLPWQINYQRNHAPHWFIIDSIDESTGCLHITDAFAFTDTQGDQQPFAGWIAWADLSDLAQLDLTLRDVFQYREQHAFGDDENLTAVAFKGFQWFEASDPPHAKPLAPEQMLQLLTTTTLFHTGQRKRADLSPQGWVSGSAALRFLGTLVEQHLDNPTLYIFQDDLWVAARNRQLFALVLERLGHELALPSLSDLATWCRTEVAERWSTLIWIMEYCQQSLARGQRPRPRAIALCNELAPLEDELIARLGDLLSTDAKVDRRLYSPATASTNATPPAYLSAASQRVDGAKQSAEAQEPKTADEQLIAAIWADVLHIERVGLYDSFLHLGGNSLQAVQLITRLREAYQLDLALFSQLTLPNVAEMARLIKIIRWARQEDQVATDVSNDREEIEL